MSTASTSLPQPVPRREEVRTPDRGVTFPRVFDSEWIKFRSLRSSWYTLLAAVVSMVAIGGLICWATNNRWNHMRARELAGFEPITHSLVGTNLAQLAIGVLGVLIISGEYATGMIRSTLAAVPRRLPVLWAKTLLFAAITFVTMLVSSFAAFFVGQALLGSHGTTIHAAGAVHSVLGVAAYLTFVGILAVALGFILRSTAGGIATLVGILLILPGIGDLLPSSWQPHILPYLPSNAGSALYAVHRDPGSLSTTGGVITLLVWCAAALIIAATMLRRRDA